MSVKTLKDAVAALYEVETKYWRHQATLVTLTKKIVASTIPVVSLSRANDAALLVKDKGKGKGKGNTILVQPITIERLVLMPLKDTPLGDKYVATLAKRDALTDTRWELFSSAVEMAQRAPLLQKWPKPEDSSSTRVLELAMKLVYKPIRVGFTVRPRLAWCFDGFDY